MSALLCCVVHNRTNELHWQHQQVAQVSSLWTPQTGTQHLTNTLIPSPFIYSLLSLFLPIFSRERETLKSRISQCKQFSEKHILSLFNLIASFNQE